MDSTKVTTVYFSGSCSKYPLRVNICLPRRSEPPLRDTCCGLNDVFLHRSREYSLIPPTGCREPFPCNCTHKVNKRFHPWQPVKTRWKELASGPLCQFSEISSFAFTAQGKIIASLAHGADIFPLALVTVSFERHELFKVTFFFKQEQDTYVPNRCKVQNIPLESCCVCDHV